MTKLSLPVGKAGQRNRGWIPGVHRGIDYGWYNADRTNSKRIFAAAPGTVIKVTNTSGWGLGEGCCRNLPRTDGGHRRLTRIAPSL